MVPYNNFMPFPCMQSHGIIWFHAWNRMESYDSMHGIAWNHMVPCMEPYGIILFHAWNCMELYNCRHEIGLNHMENEGMTSKNIENIKIIFKTTGRTSRIRSKITERTTGTRSKKKR